MTLRGEAALLTAEVVAIVVFALAALPVPAQLPLLVVATISLGLRRRTWSARFAPSGSRLAIGAATGAAALVIALLITPALEHQTGGLVQWTSAAAVRGKPEMFITFALIATVVALATEMILRGWILERVLEHVRGRTGAVAAIAIAAVVEAVFTAEPGAPAFGSFLVGVALGTMYLASGRSLVAPVAARVVFDVGLLLLQATKLVA